MQATTEPMDRLIAVCKALLDDHCLAVCPWCESTEGNAWHKHPEGCHGRDIAAAVRGVEDAGSADCPIVLVDGKGAGAGRQGAASPPPGPAPVEVTPSKPPMAELDTIFTMCQEHAEDTGEFNNQILDLQDVLTAAWRRLTPVQRQEVFEEYKADNDLGDNEVEDDSNNDEDDTTIWTDGIYYHHAGCIDLDEDDVEWRSIDAANVPPDTDCEGCGGDILLPPVRAD